MNFSSRLSLSVAQNFVIKFFVWNLNLMWSSTNGGSDKIKGMHQSYIICVDYFLVCDWVYIFLYGPGWQSWPGTAGFQPNPT